MNAMVTASGFANWSKYVDLYTARKPWKVARRLK